MTRLSKTQYDLRVFAAMVVYVALVLVLLPHARHAETLLPRLASSLLPTISGPEASCVFRHWASASTSRRCPET